MFLEDYGDPNESVSIAAERQFKEHYLCHLGDGARFVRLESPFSVKCQFSVLILCKRNAETRNALLCSS